MTSVDQITSSPTVLEVGIDSPVIIDSSISALPEMIFPSKGIFSHGLTIIISPNCTCSSDTCISLPSLRIMAFFACSHRSALIACPVLDMTFASIYFHISINQMTTITAS